MRTTALLAAAALLFGLVSWAAAGPVVGTSANTIPQGTFMIDTWTIWKNYTRSYTDNLWAEGDDGWIDFPEANSIVSASLVPRVYYGVTDWITMRVSLPVEYRLFDSEFGSEDTNLALGDVVIDPKIQLFRGEDGYPRVAFLTGVRLGTGDVDGTPSCSDGSTDFVVGGAVTHDLGPIVAHATAVYWFNGENDNGHDIKNLWSTTVSLEDPLTENWSLHWEVTGYLGEEPADYYRFYACPGVAYNGERVTWGLSSMISFASHGGGGVSYVDFDWAPYFKIYYRFF